MNSTEAKSHPAWPEFEALAEDLGINLDHPDDWELDWKVFFTGYNAGYNSACLKWQPMETAPLDGTDVLLLTKTHGITQAWFDRGHVIPATSECPEDYSGDAWICADDEFQIEAEFDGRYWHHGEALCWAPKPELPKEFSNESA